MNPTRTPRIIRIIIAPYCLEPKKDKENRYVLAPEFLSFLLGERKTARIIFQPGSGKQEYCEVGYLISNSNGSRSIDSPRFIWSRTWANRKARRMSSGMASST